MATTKALIASTLPSLVLPAPWARPDRAARAASTASAGPTCPYAARLAVGPVHLDDFDALAAQRPRDTGAVRARALDADLGQPALAQQPGEQLFVARRGGRELGHPEHAPQAVHRRRYVQVQVRAHTARHGLPQRVYDRICHPLSPLLEGVARAAPSVRRRCDRPLGPGRSAAPEAASCH